MILREIEDNLSYREYTKLIEDLKRDKQDKEEELNRLPSKQELSKMLDNMRREHSQKNDEEQQLRGVVQQLQQQVHFTRSQMQSCSARGLRQ